MTDMLYAVMPVVAVLIVAVVTHTAEFEARRADRSWKKETAAYQTKTEATVNKA